MGKREERADGAFTAQRVARRGAAGRQRPRESYPRCPRVDEVCTTGCPTLGTRVGCRLAHSKQAMRGRAHRVHGGPRRWRKEHCAPGLPAVAPPPSAHQPVSGVVATTWLVKTATLSSSPSSLRRICSLHPLDGVPAFLLLSQTFIARSPLVRWSRWLHSRLPFFESPTARPFSRQGVHRLRLEAGLSLHTSHILLPLRTGSYCRGPFRARLSCGRLCCVWQSSPVVKSAWSGVV